MKLEAVALLTTLSLGACSDEDGASTSPDASLIDASVDAFPQPDGAEQDAPPPGDAAATTDATPDATGDAAFVRKNVIFASFDGTLVRIDPETGASTPVGLLRNKANQTEVYNDPVMAWTGALDQAVIITDYDNPVLGTVDLCSALVTKGAAITRAASPKLVVEGLARHPNGTWYAAGGNAPNPNSPQSSHIGTLNLTTGAFTDLGNAVDTLQDDVDMLFFRGTTLYGVDVATDNSRIDLFTINLTNGADTNVMSPTYSAQNQVPLRWAFDESRAKAFAWRASDRNLLQVDLETNMVTPIGPTHAAGMYGNQNVRAFFVAHAPECP